jgi:hypothetical protein
MPITQILLTSSGGGAPTPIYTLTPAANNVDEGSSLTFTVGGTDVPDGTYYWTIETNADNFLFESGSTALFGPTGSNLSTFVVYPIADATTEGTETFTVALRSVSTSGTILVTSSAVTINDTSVDPVAPFSLDFPEGNAHLLVSNTQSDWNLGTTYTIEFWSKQTNASTSNIRTVMSQGADQVRIDLGFMFGSTLFAGAQRAGIPEPTAGVWSHTAYVADGGGNTKVYYNGVFNGEIVNPGALGDGSSDLYIGKRGPGINGQGFLGKLAMIRISTTAKYTADFTPTINYGAGADTRLMMGSDTPLIDSVGTHPISVQGAVTVSTDFPSAPPAPTYVLTPMGDNISEGGALTFEVSGTNIPNGTYYWTIETGGSEFDASSGSFSITSNNGTFDVNATADDTTEGAETFTVVIRSGSITGTELVAPTSPITINDTSLNIPTYDLIPAGNTVNEGSSLRFDISGTDITNGTYYWTIQDNISDFGTSSGEVTITDNTGSFTVTPTADATTEGDDTFTVSLREGSIAGIILATSTSVTIIDTSTDPVPPFSLMFNNPQQDFLRVPASADWNLGNNWTIEFWMKANNPSNAGVNIPGGQWGLINQGGWYYGMPNDNCILVGLAAGNLTINQSATNAIEFAEPLAGGVPFGDVTKTSDNQGWGEGQVGINLPTTGGTGTGLTVNVSDGGSNYSNIVINTPGIGYTNGDEITVTSYDESISETFIIFASVPVWTHVAVVNNGGGSAQKVYYNGFEQTKVSGSYTSNGKTNISDDLYIGRLAPNYNGYFDGKMSMVRISNTAKYLTAFNPSVTYGVEADTVLFLDSDTPLADTSYYELNNVSVVTNTLTTIYISKSAYPNLDKQVRVGNTVTKVSDSTTCIVTAPVFTADPDNWGVDVSPGWSGVATVNFSGARHTIVNNGTTVSEEFPGTLTVRQWIGAYTGGGSASQLYVRPTDYPTAGDIPVGAKGTVSNDGTLTSVTVMGNASTTAYGESLRLLTFDVSGLVLRAGSYGTFVWSTT